MENKTIPIGYCQCGCGEKTDLATRKRTGYNKGEPLLYRRGHIGKLNALKHHNARVSVDENGITIKQCTKCNNHLPLTAFNCRRHKFNARCITCTCEDYKKYYANNPTPYRERAKISGVKIRQEGLERLRRIKLQYGCRVCGETELCCLDFHHMVKGKPSISRTVKSVTALNNEIVKCAVLCANCHRKVHNGIIMLDDNLKCKITDGL